MWQLLLLALSAIIGWRIMRNPMGCLVTIAIVFLLCLAPFFLNIPDHSGHILNNKQCAIAIMLIVTLICMVPILANILTKK